jgi:hypothetical protein
LLTDPAATPPSHVGALSLCGAQASFNRNAVLRKKRDSALTVERKDLMGVFLPLRSASAARQWVRKSTGIGQMNWPPLQPLRKKRYAKAARRSCQSIFISEPPRPPKTYRSLVRTTMQRVLHLTRQPIHRTPHVGGWPRSVANAYGQRNHRTHAQEHSGA